MAYIIIIVIIIIVVPAETEDLAEASEASEAAAAAPPARVRPPIPTKGYHDQDPTKKLVQMGRQGAYNVASASVCVMKTTWNMKHRLERQQDHHHHHQPS